MSKWQNTGLKFYNDSRAFIEYSNDMGDIYKNIEECNPNKNTQNIDRIRLYDCWYT